MSRKDNTSIRSAFLAIRQLSCIIVHLKKIQINLNLCSIGLGRIIHRSEDFFSDSTTLLYYRSPKKNQISLNQCSIGLGRIL